MRESENEAAANGGAAASITNHDSSDRYSFQREAHAGSYSAEDSGQPQWDWSTKFERSHIYPDDKGRYTYTVIIGRKADGTKAVLKGRLLGGNDLQIEKAENPRDFYPWDGLTNYKRQAGDHPLVLYRQHELELAMAARPDDEVFICEGEKDVDTIWAAGGLATCNPDGATKWDPKFNKFFLKRNVRIPEDNDLRGKQHAKKVADGVYRYAASVKILTMPGLEEHGDVTDWFNAGHTLADLIELADKAPESSADNGAEPLDLIDAGTLAGKSVQPMAFIIHKLVPANLVTLLTAQGGGGKSYITLQLCAATSLGALAYGQQTISAPAIYITAEDDADENHRRLIGVANALNTGIDSFTGKLFLVSLVERREKGLARVDAQSNKLTVLQLFHEVRASILKVSARFVVLDNVAHLFEGNENIRAHVAAFLGLLNSLALETRCAIILISHPNKSGDSFSGSTAFQNQVRSHIHLDVDPNDPDARTLKLMKANYARLDEPLRLRWHKGSFRLEDSIPAHENTATSRDRLADQLFLTCLDARNATQRPVSQFVQAGATYAPKALALMTQAKGMSVDMFESAMERLLATGVIEQGTLDYDKPNSPGHRATGLNKIGVLEASDEPF